MTTWEKQLRGAASRGNAEKLSQILSIGRSPDVPDIHGQYPLHFAASNGYLGCVKLIVKAGGNIDVKSNEQLTPLMESARNGHAEVVAYLLRKGADVQLTDRDGGSALHCAASASGSCEGDSHSFGHNYGGNSEGCIDLLLRVGARADLRDNLGLVPLHRAASRGNLSAINALLNHTAQVRDAKDDAGRAPLHLAALAGSVDCIVALLEAGADINSVTKPETGLSPLHFAARAGSPECVAVLLRRGADASIHGTDGTTALHHAAYTGCSRCVILLASKVSSVNSRDSRGSTPLHYAAARNNRDSVRLLMRKGGDSTQKNNDGLTPIEAARDNTRTIEAFQTQSEANRKKSRWSRRMKNKSPRKSTEVYATQVKRSQEKSQRQRFGTQSFRPPQEHGTPDFHPPPERHAQKSKSESRDMGTRGRSSTMPSLGSPSHASSPSLPVPIDKTADGPVYDRYGFVQKAAPTPQSEEKMRKKERDRSMKWVRMFSAWDSRKDTAKVKERVMKGIPDCVRGEAWRLFLQVNKLKDSHPSDTFHKLLGGFTRFDPDIKRDLDRTYPHHVYFEDRQGHGQKRLYNVLKAYAVYNPTVGYCQGMGFTVGLLLMYMEEEDAFWGLVRLCKEYKMDGVYMEGFPGLARCNHVLLSLVLYYLPRVHAHLEKEGVEPSMYTPQWFMTVFTYNLPFPVVLRIWDVFLLHGFPSVYIFSLALFKLFANKVLTLSFQPLFSFLRLDPDAHEQPLPPLDPEQLLHIYKSFLQKGALNKALAYEAAHNASVSD